jgi:hypothetical protein
VKYSAVFGENCLNFHAHFPDVTASSVKIAVEIANNRWILTQINSSLSLILPANGCRSHEREREKNFIAYHDLNII